jgi:hypothetical protein
VVYSFCKFFRNIKNIVTRNDLRHVWFPNSTPRKALKNTINVIPDRKGRLQHYAVDITG